MSTTEVLEMRRANSRVPTLLLVVAVVSALCIAPVGGAFAQDAQTDQGYTISIQTPDQVVAADGQSIGVEVDNTEGSSDLFNPVIEIPLPADYNVTDQALNSAYVEYANGTTAPVSDASRQGSSFRSGDAVYLFGENIPQGETFTYKVNMSIESPGNSTLEAETRLLYNENDPAVTARTNTTVQAAGFGTVGAVVDGDAATGTEVQINGSAIGIGSATAERVAGSYTITAEAPAEAAVELPEFTQTVGVNENVSVSYTVPETLTGPQVIATTQTGSVLDGSASQSVTQQATAEQSREVTASFLLQTSGGETVVALTEPDTGPIATQTVTVDSGSAQLSETVKGPTARVNSTDNTGVTATFTGYRLGDADKDGSVDASDAEAVADVVVTGEAGDRYYDVNGDGEVTAVDAMLIAQYDSNNRGADYT